MVGDQLWQFLKKHPAQMLVDYIRKNHLLCEFKDCTVSCWNKPEHECPICHNHICDRHSHYTPPEAQDYEGVEPEDHHHLDDSICKIFRSCKRCAGVEVK